VNKVRISLQCSSHAAGGSPQPVVISRKGMTRSVRLITLRTVSAERSSAQAGWVGCRSCPTPLTSSLILST
jgi:hypothetical protein